MILLKALFSSFLLALASCVCYAQIIPWKTFTSREGAFSVTFPGEPTVTETNNKSPEGYTVRAKMHMINESPAVTYVIYNEFEAGVNIMDDSIYINTVVDQLLQRFNREPQELENISIDGFPGKHFVIDFDDGIAEGKIILRTNRAYFIVGFYPHDQADNLKKFMNSFKLLPYQKTNWVSYESKEYGFKMDFPSEPRQDIEKNDAAGTELFVFYGLDPASGNNYSLAVEKYSRYAQYESDSAILAERVAVYQMDGADTIISERDIKIAGRPGKEVLINKGKNHFKMKLRTFTYGDLGFTLFAFLPEKEANGEVASHFFNSFRFVGTPKGDLLSDKTDLLLKDIQGNDSTIVEEAKASIQWLKMDSSRIPELENLIRQSYPDDNTMDSRKEFLLDCYAFQQSERALNFIPEVFPSLNKNPVYELIAMRALASLESQSANNILADLLKTHVPDEDNEDEYGVLFAYNRDSLVAKDFLLKTIPLITQQAYKRGIYSLISELTLQKVLSLDEIGTYRNTWLSDFKEQSQLFLKDSTYRALISLIEIVGSEKLGKGEIENLKKLSASYDKYTSIKANVALMRQNQKVDAKQLKAIASDKYFRADLWFDMSRHQLEKFFPKEFARQDSLAVAEVFVVVSDEYFGPSQIRVELAEEREYKGAKKTFFVIRFFDPSEEVWYRTVAGPYDLKRISTWSDLTGIAFDQLDEALTAKDYLQGFLDQYGEE